MQIIQTGPQCTKQVEVVKLTCKLSSRFWPCGLQFSTSSVLKQAYPPYQGTRRHHSQVPLICQLRAVNVNRLCGIHNNAHSLPRLRGGFRIPQRQFELSSIILRLKSFNPGTVCSCQNVQKLSLSTLLEIILCLFQAPMHWIRCARIRTLRIKSKIHYGWTRRIGAEISSANTKMAPLQIMQLYKWTFTLIESR